MTKFSNETFSSSSHLVEATKSLLDRQTKNILSEQEILHKFSNFINETYNIDLLTDKEIKYLFNKFINEDLKSDALKMSYSAISRALQGKAIGAAKKGIPSGGQLKKLVTGTANDNVAAGKDLVSKAATTPTTKPVKVIGDELAGAAKNPPPVKAPSSGPPSVPPGGNPPSGSPPSGDNLPAVQGSRQVIPATTPKVKSGSDRIDFEHARRTATDPFKSNALRNTALAATGAGVTLGAMSTGLGDDKKTPEAPKADTPAPKAATPAPKVAPGAGPKAEPKAGPELTPKAPAPEARKKPTGSSEQPDWVKKAFNPDLGS